MSFFKPKHIKEGKLLLKGVRKFVRYNRDLISPENGKKVEVMEGEFRESLDRGDISKEELNEAAVKLTKACERSVPSYNSSLLKENLEVIFVAVVIAMGIRAYFFQPFKIPTGSMQPTLNGIIAHPHIDADPMNGTDYTEPGRLGQIWEKIFYGRTYVNLVAEGDDVVLLGKKEDAKVMKFFSRAKVPMRSGRTYTLPGPASKVETIFTNTVRNRNPVVKKGQTIARGYLDTGDQVLVDKFTYHWRKPKRGEVFVFVTRGISGIERGFTPSQQLGGAQHYIKRLAGVPGDKLEVKPPNLLINGEIAKEEGFRKVMSRENGYTGYTYDPRIMSFDLGPEQYVALGDNSKNSSDSRNWGTVPRDNIIGRAVCVYLPLGHHWGKIH